jgi:transposase
LSDSEIFSRVERRRRWSPAEKAALLAEVAAEGGQVRLVARRHRISPSLLYNWRAVWASATTLEPATPAHFIPLGRISEANPAAPVPPVPRPRPAGKGGIEITLPNGDRVTVDAAVDETALSAVLRAMKAAP